MTGYELYCLYLSIANHFRTPSYDYFKYHGKVRANRASFEKRKDARSFHYMAKKFSNLTYATNFVLANIIEGRKWFPEFNEAAYMDWKRRQESLGYIFKDDLSNLNADFDSNFTIEDDQTPFIIKAWATKKISLETFVILLDIVNAIPYYSEMLVDDVLWDSGTLPIKYLPFLKKSTYEPARFKETTLKHFGV